MPFRREKRESSQLPPEEAHDAPPPPGPHVLFDGPVLARWFIVYRLEQELYRARRYGAPLTVLISDPQLIVGERVRRDGPPLASRRVRWISSAGSTTTASSWCCR